VLDSLDFGVGVLLWTFIFKLDFIFFPFARLCGKSSGIFAVATGNAIKLEDKGGLIGNLVGNFVAVVLLRVVSGLGCGATIGLVAGGVALR
jgi:hypothetical protein